MVVKQQEIPLLFDCQDHKLLGIIHQCPDMSRTGVLIIVGGPQYRIGSHRQFLLLARALSARQIATMRFDVRGMGDAEGDAPGFQSLDADIRAAIDCFFANCPQLQRVVLWGLCDAASAAVFYAHNDPRVQGLVLLNPWIFTQQGAAKTYLKHYYLKRLLNQDFWKKFLTCQLDYANSFASLLNFLHMARSARQTAKIANGLPLPVRLRECLRSFCYPVLLILSGRDLTASEFTETTGSDPQWRALLQEERISTLNFTAADHTFSSSQWRNQIAEWTADWIDRLDAQTSTSTASG